MSKHWRFATKEQIVWADANGFVVWESLGGDMDHCRGCVLLMSDPKGLCQCAPCVGIGGRPSVIFELNEEEEGNE